MGQVGLAPFLVRYIKLLATAAFVILVWTIVDRAVESPTHSEHASRSLQAEKSQAELAIPHEEASEQESGHKDADAPSLPNAPTQWTDTNSTLGFGTILAVSHATSKRKAGLLWAANITGIDIEIPDQPVWSQGDIDAIRMGKTKWVTKGTAMAWLGHLNALRKFLASPHETALILEDDADWDIALRTSEVPLAASALRHLFHTNSPNHQYKYEQQQNPQQPQQQAHHMHHQHHHPSHPSQSRSNLLTSSTDPHYWGDTSTWEILHLGHSDSEFYDRENGATLARIHSNPSTAYPDPSLPDPDRINPATKTLLYSLAVPLSSRLWHRSHWPLGSYAYGITRAAATRIVDLYSSGSTGSASADAFDVVLLELCRDHGWKCWTLEPGLIGEYYTPSEIALQNLSEEERRRAREEEEIYDTWNLRCAVRQRALWVDEGDEGGRAGMIEKVGRGECPVEY
ncbi:unnamed protein product [Periconia digitata]|uniref:Glycosyltransferase family 25 protein n=1 Tax=Periconia digitata TaxID=1303443 RepID=A0A9W4U5B0_9PLEO|nr:unnamed protein product [Periconia digitata]